MALAGGRQVKTSYGLDSHGMALAGGREVNNLPILCTVNASAVCHSFVGHGYIDHDYIGQ